MSQTQRQKKVTLSQPARYIVQVQGLLSDSWTISLNHATITRDDQRDITTLSAPAIDQAALFGLLHRLNNLGLPLLCVVNVDGDDSCLSLRDEFNI